ncbi:MAG TPA: c-type cytochrome, partial [Alphaproteobacteria bacterium]|nr:c-type cytochrome [Alphaproteobacteria bacterium]
MNLAKSLALSTAFAIGLGAVPALAQDTAKGKRLFKRCAACHTLEEGGKNKVGPNLFGILGRQIATAENFRFSNAFKELDFAWDEAKM